MANNKPPSSFEPLDNLRAAWMHHYLGIEQHAIAASFGINPGRVNEACRAIGYAMAEPRKFLAIIEAQLQPDTVKAVEDALHEREDEVAPSATERSDTFKMA